MDHRRCVLACRLRLNSKTTSPLPRHFTLCGNEVRACVCDRHPCNFCHQNNTFVVGATSSPAIRNTAHAELIREAAAATLNLEQPSEDEQPQATSHDELQTALRQTFIPHNGNGIVHRSGDMAAVGRHNTATATSAGVALVAGCVAFGECEVFL